MSHPAATNTTACTLTPTPDETWIRERYGNMELGFLVEDTLYSGQSEFQKVDVVKTREYGNLLLLDDCVMTTERDEFVYHEMVSHVPLLSLPHEAKQVLIIGGGDGGTVREVLRHASVETVVLCEIDGDVIDVSKQYLPSIAGTLDDPRVDVQVRDGVAYMAEQDNRFDVIIIDSTDPMGPGTGLFTVDFYRNAAKAMRPGGILTAQTESPFAEPEGLKRIYANLRQVFSITQAYWGVIPTYPGAMWTWAFCSQTVEPLVTVDPDKAAAIAGQCKYYNLGVHQGAFQLPNFVADLVNGSDGV
jgi:spermidine synthase